MEKIMNNADVNVLMGRLLDREPLDSHAELEQGLSNQMDMNSLRAFARENGLIRKAGLVPARVAAGA
ncbi:hypothetical protein BI313_00545 (plasmid) [Xanthomonas vesicatoria]|nr:hypothetical protein BI313_00545 [Xanthomonas vesicatoria]OLR69763.1 hypothetical protein BI311_23925 [Xanthomonas citri pv. citri]